MSTPPFQTHVELARISERANVWLYDSKDQALGLFQWLNLAVNLSGVVGRLLWLRPFQKLPDNFSAW